MTILKRYKLEIAIFFIALLVRLFYLGVSIETQGDVTGAIEGADYYYQIADNVLEGRGYSSKWEPPYIVNSFRTPIMPYFIVAAHQLLGGYVGAILLHIFIGSLLSVIGMRLARFVTDISWVPIVVGVIMALNPYDILFSTIFYSETIFTLLFFISLWHFFSYLQIKRPLHLVFSGAFLGFATLAKPTTEFLPLLLGLCVIWFLRSDIKKGLIHALLLVGMTALMVSPWVYRNYLVTGTAALSPQTGVQLYTVLWPSVLSIKNGTSFGDEFKKLIASGVSGPNDATVAQSAAYMKIALPLIFANPLPLAKVSANNIVGFFTHDGMYDVLRHLEIHPDSGLGGPALFLALKDPAKFIGAIVHFAGTPFVLILIARVWWVAITALFMYGAMRALYRRHMVSVVALLIVAYFMLTTLVVGLAVNARYRLPVEVFVITIALTSLSSIVHKFSRHEA